MNTEQCYIIDSLYVTLTELELHSLMKRELAL